MKLQDVKDVVRIYSNCEIQYGLSWWNYIDFANMSLWNSGVVHKDDGDKIIFSCTSHPQKFQPHNYIKTIEDLKKFVEDTQYLDGKTEIIIINKDNHHPMRATFSGSSNIDNKIYFSVFYEDNYHEWKLKLRYWLLKIKCKIEKIKRR